MSNQPTNAKRPKLANTDRFVHGTYLSDWKHQIYQPRSPLVSLPPEIKRYIIWDLSFEALARLGQCCKSWFILTAPELYTRDAKEGNSFAMKWAAAHAVDDDTTEIALKILKRSAEFGGQVNAIHRDFPTQHGDMTVYETSTALHHAVLTGNLRMASRLMKMGARHDIPCSGPRWVFQATGATWLRERVEEFKSFYPGRFHYGGWLPLFLAFLHKDPAMGSLLIDCGASRDAVLIYPNAGITQPISILHFAVANQAKDFHKWEFLFSHFSRYIDEACTEAQDTPLHVALKSGNIRGMQIAVRSGADMEAQNLILRTPLIEGILQASWLMQFNSKRHEHMACLREFVELGASVNPQGDSVLVPALSYYRGNPMICPDALQLIDFFLDRGADVNGHNMHGQTVIQELIMAIFSTESYPSVTKVLKKLLKNLVQRGLDLTSPPPGVTSPLCAVLLHRDAQPAWLFQFLCDNGATIHREEATRFFIYWSRIPRLWRKKTYDIWQHASTLPSRAIDIAYQTAFTFDAASLYNILTRKRLAASSNEKLVKFAFFSKKRWSWKKIVACKFAGTFVSAHRRENMLHLTVRFYDSVPKYSAEDAIRDVSRLLKNGADITSQNNHGLDPLELLLHLKPKRKDSMHLLAALEERMRKAYDTQIKRQLQEKQN
ncbi:hypothetical protein E4U55_007529 [Claviceps digitariae]|nr:hypothetical protein E4U55_007529 [Claviceps digitariae]